MKAFGGMIKNYCFQKRRGISRPYKLQPIDRVKKAYFLTCNINEF